MKESFLFIIAWATIFFGGMQMIHADEEPELTVFKACLDKATILNDSTICDCAEFVGHPNWCNGDIKY